MQFNFIKVQPPAPRIQNKAEVDRLYSHWRVRHMYALFIGYAIFYFCRKNLSAATPGLIADLGYSKTSIGTIWSVMYLVYGVGKFINGVLGDRTNPRYFMAIGIFLSAVTNIFFGMSSSLFVLGIMWALNGWFQSMGGPACARGITQWFSPNELGTKWGFWNISHQIGGALVLVLAGYLTQNYGWRYSFYVPAGIGIICALFLMNRLRDTPESLGLPDIAEYRNDHIIDQANKLDKKHPVKDIVMHHVLKNKQIWLLAIANFFVYLVRYGAMDWAPTYLVEVKHSTIANASYKTALFEILGIVGSILAGWLSDRYFPTKRNIMNVLYMAGLIFAILGFWTVPQGYPVFDALLLGLVGFLVYGPQMLVGVCAAESAGKTAAATANGMTGLFGYLGGIASGIGTGWAVQTYGWSGGFTLFTASAIIGTVCFIAAVRNESAQSEVSALKAVPATA